MSNGNARDRDRQRCRTYKALHKEELRAKQKAKWPDKKAAVMAMATRFCTQCRTQKPSAEFYPTYKTRCRACLKANAAPNQPQKRLYVREWQAKNRDKVEKWRADNKQRLRQWAREWLSKQPQEVKERKRQYLARWYKANTHRFREYAARREAAMLRATPAWADAAAMRAIYREAARLTTETGVAHEVDHIVPLRSSIVCGLHWAGNMQILTKTANRQKSNRLMPHLEVPLQGIYAQEPSQNLERTI